MALAGVPAAFAAVWIPAFAGIAGAKNGNDREIGKGGAEIVRFSIMSVRPRLKRTTIAPIFPFSLRPLRLRAKFSARNVNAP